MGGGKREKPSGRVPNRQLVRQTASLFRAHRAGVAAIAGLVVITAGAGVINPVLIKVVFDTALFPTRTVAATPSVATHLVYLPVDLPRLEILVGIMIGITIVTGRDRRAPDLRHQPRGSARDGGVAQPPLRAPAGDVAPFLHRHANRRDPVPAHQRRRRHPVRRHRYGDVAPVQHRDPAEHAGRDADAVLAADRAVAGDHPALRLLHVSRRQGAPPDHHAGAGIEGRDQRHHRGDAVGVGHAPRQGLRPRPGGGRRASGRRTTGSPTSPSARR